MPSLPSACVLFNRDGDGRAAQLGTAGRVQTLNLLVKFQKKLAGTSAGSDTESSEAPKSALPSSNDGDGELCKLHSLRGWYVDAAACWARAHPARDLKARRRR